MSLFDKEKDEMLIKLVRGKPVIYDSSHPQHRDLIAKHAEWKEISTAMVVPIADIQKRWKHFRDHYKKKKKLKSKKNTWRYMHLLEFLSAPPTLSQSDNRRLEEQRKALLQEPQTPELSDISIFSFEDLEELEARSNTPLPGTDLKFTSNTISPTREPEDIKIFTMPLTSFHYNNIQKKRKPESESSLSVEAFRRRLITTEDQNSSNSEDIYPTNAQSIDEKIFDSDINIEGRHDSRIQRYFALIAEISTMFPPHLVSHLKLRIHKSIYQIELEWQKEKREKEERKKTNRLISKFVFNHRQLNLN